MLTLDHIALGTADLKQGVAALKETMGVEIPQGGQHPLMGTHNHVMRTGEAEFFELIAVDKEAPKPSRPRWFTLDDPATQNHISDRPRALCWVVKTNDIEGLVKNSPFDLGEITSVTRGDLQWRLTVPQDGSLVEGGLLPAFIQWNDGPHPATKQQDCGVRIKQIHLTHPQPDRLYEMLDALNVAHLAKIDEGARALSFEVETPKGVIILD